MSSDDPLYPQARQASIEHGFVSVAYLQRHFRIGYIRAARLVDAMKEDGFCSRISVDGCFELTASYPRSQE